jgi:hypothetical protein
MSKMERKMKKILCLSVGFSVLAFGIANAQFADHRPPPVINFSKSPRTMAEEALNDARQNGTLKRETVIEETVVETEPSEFEAKIVESKVEKVYVVDIEPEVKSEEKTDVVVKSTETETKTTTTTTTTYVEQPQTEYVEYIKIPQKKIEVYDVIDTDKDGYISKEEYDDFAAKRATKIFEDMDNSGDGILTREEFNYYKRRNTSN